MVTDYLFCERLIMERLRGEVQEFREVNSAAGLAQMQDEEYAPNPSAYVIYQGDVINTSVAATGGVQARTQFVTQLWAVVICVYLADGRGLGEDINSAAGPLIKRVIDTLASWTPDPKVCRPMVRSGQQLPAQYENGYGYYPLVFQVQIPAAIGGYR